MIFLQMALGANFKILPAFDIQAFLRDQLYKQVALLCNDLNTFAQLEQVLVTLMT